MSFISFYGLFSLSRTYTSSTLNRGGDNRYCLVLSLRGKVFSLSPWSKMWAVSFSFHMAFARWGSCPLFLVYFLKYSPAVLCFVLLLWGFWLLIHSFTSYSSIQISIYSWVSFHRLCVSRNLSTLSRLSNLLNNCSQ